MDCEAYECCDTELGAENEGAKYESDGALCDENEAAEISEGRDEGLSRADGSDAKNAAFDAETGENAAFPEQKAGELFAGADELRRAAQLERIAKTSPALASRYLPEGFAARARAGMSMREAAISWKNERLMEENLALRQEAANAARIIGSADSAGKRSADAFDEQWYDGT